MEEQFRILTNYMRNWFRTGIYKYFSFSYFCFNFGQPQLMSIQLFSGILLPFSLLTNGLYDNNNLLKQTNKNKYDFSIFTRDYH